MRFFASFILNRFKQKNSETQWKNALQTIRARLWEANELKIMRDNGGNKNLLNMT